MTYNPQYSATTKDLIASIAHCRECKKDIFWSLELGLNIVAIWKPLNGTQRILNFKSEGMRQKDYKVNDILIGRLFISIWCPFCNRIQNKEIYIPEWKEVKGEIIRNEMPKLST